MTDGSAFANLYLLRSITPQLTLRQVAGILAVFQDFFSEYLSPHTLHSLRGEELEGIRDSKRRHSSALGKF